MDKSVEEVHGHGNDRTVKLKVVNDAVGPLTDLSSPFFDGSFGGRGRIVPGGLANERRHHVEVLSTEEEVELVHGKILIQRFGLPKGSQRAFLMSNRGDFHTKNRLSR